MEAVKEEGQVYWAEVKSPDCLDRITRRLKGFAEIAKEKGKKMLVKIVFQNREEVKPDKVIAVRQAHG